jgi:hypothetical protein
LGYWGWTQHTGILQILLGIGVPVLAAVLWGVFRVPGEPGDAPVSVRGWVRLLELGLFAVAVVLLASAGQTTTAIIFGGLVLLEYAVSYDRIRRYLTEK